MVNSFFIRGKFPPYFLFFVFLFLGSNIFSQKISKYYTSLSSEDGTLFFVTPKQKFANRKQTFVYDLTYKTGGDTVTLNFTFLDKKVMKLDSLVLLTENQRLSSKTTKLFIDYKNSKKCSHRYSSKFLFSELQLFYKSKKTPLIYVWSSGKANKLSIKKCKWRKKSKIASMIFELIDVNRKE